MANRDASTTPTAVAGKDAGDETTSKIGEQAEKVAGAVTSALGARMEQAGEFLDDKPKAAFISERLQSAGRYLQENDVRSISRSVDSAITSHPYRSILIGLGAGYLIGRLMRH
jgi:ElaB/YqjD/DUF883 family membrane-anchored ribosome-binding protein